MSEEEILTLGFEKTYVNDNESQNGYDYYYYQKEMCSGIILHSTDNVDVEDDQWTLKAFEIPAIEIKSKDHYLHFLEVMKNIIC